MRGSFVPVSRFPFASSRLDESLGRIVKLRPEGAKILMPVYDKICEAMMPKPHQRAGCEPDRRAGRSGRPPMKRAPDFTRSGRNSSSIHGGFERIAFRHNARHGAFAPRGRGDAQRAPVMASSEHRAEKPGFYAHPICAEKFLHIPMSPESGRNQTIKDWTGLTD